MKKVFTALALCLVALPLAAIVTFLLIPLWRWLEATTGVESIGHSGPANWCFVAVYLVILAAAFGIWFFSSGSGPSSPGEKR